MNRRGYLSLSPHQPSFHADRAQLPRVVRTPEGYLRGEAVVTRLGVFQYDDEAGAYRFELRHPDDVFAQESLDSLKMIPVTVGHPPEQITSANVSRYAVGATGEHVRVDGDKIVVPILITHRDGVEAAREASQLSLGYNLKLVEERGTYYGEPYTHRQTAIRYNHLALVPSGRAGVTASLNFDAASEMHFQMEASAAAFARSVEQLNSWRTK